MKNKNKKMQTYQKLNKEFLMVKINIYFFFFLMHKLQHISVKNNSFF